MAYVEVRLIIERKDKKPGAGNQLIRGMRAGNSGLLRWVSRPSEVIPQTLICIFPPQIYRSLSPFPLRICRTHFAALASRVLDCLGAEK